MNVRLPDGSELGTVQQRVGLVCCQRSIEVRDANKKLVYTLEGPMQCAPNLICREYRLDILDQKVGHQTVKRASLLNV